MMEPYQKSLEKIEDLDCPSMFLRISSPLDRICAWISDIFHLKLKVRILALSEQKLKGLASTRRRIFVIFAAQRQKSVGPAGFVAAGVVFAVFVRGYKGATRCGTIFVNCTVGVFSDSACKNYAFGVVLDLSAFHAAVDRVKLSNMFWGDFPNPIRLGLAPVKGHSKVSATGAAAEARVRFYRRVHSCRTFPGISARVRSPR